MTYSCFFFLRSAVYNLPLVALACLLTGDARGDLILAGQFAQNAGQILNDKFLAIDAYLMDLGPAIATQSSISVPSYVNPGTPGDDIISAGSQLQSGALFAAGTDLQTAGSAINHKFLAIDAYLMDLGPAIATQSSISVPSYVNPGTPGDDIISAGSQLQSVPEPSAAIMAGFLSIAVLLRRYRRATLR